MLKCEGGRPFLTLRCLPPKAPTCPGSPTPHLTLPYSLKTPSSKPLICCLVYDFVPPPSNKLKAFYLAIFICG